MKMEHHRNNLDEMQEQKLLHIERNGAWLAFWGLLAVLVIQLIIYGFGDWKALVGEWVVFMGLALYLLVACLKNGIWDRRLKPEPKTNLLCSLIAGGCCGVLFFFISYRNYGKLIGSICTGVFMLLFVTGLSMIALTVSTALYKKRVRQLENGEDEASGEDKEEIK
ncbi:MAG: DUF6773 family protein [Oscillospiraceae bacterium]|jgi:xanthine/uracil permease